MRRIRTAPRPVSRARRVRTWWLVGLSLLLSAGALSFRPGPDSLLQTGGSAEANWLGALFRVALATAGVLVLAWGSLQVVRRLLAGQKRTRQTSWFSVLAAAHVAPKKQVCLVRVFDRYLLIGLTDSGMQTLAELDAQTVSRGLEENSLGRNGAGSFAAVLGELWKGQGAIRNR
ncbi:MAG: flagellar biosynthetic protein FliO [candidate division KSB1 bacterium]|nr:flagellar biosynthetic protein FliO [candidate division KSB1 bacterium]